MSYFLPLMLLFIAPTIASGQDVIIKWSEHDCSFCGITITTIKKRLPGVTPTLILKSNFDDEDHLRNFQDLGFQTILSDSLYYSFDSSERSIIYITDNENLLFSSILKDIDYAKIKRIFETSDNSISRHFTGIENTQVTKQNIFFSTTKYIYKLDKRNLKNIVDSIEIVSQKNRKEIIRRIYGERHKGIIDSIDIVLKQIALPTKIEIKGFKAVDDYVWVMIYLNWINVEDTSSVTVFKKPFLLRYKGTSLDEVFHNPIDTLNGYIVDAVFFSILDKDRIVVSINSQDIVKKPNTLAYCKLRGNEIILQDVAQCPIPAAFIESGIGFSLTAMQSSTNYVSQVLSDNIFAMHENRSYCLNLPDEENKITLEDVNTGRPSINFEVISMFEKNREILITYRVHDTYYVSRFYLSDIAKQEQLLSFKRNSRRGFPIFADDRHIYYISEQFNMLSYKSLAESPTD